MTNQLILIGQLEDISEPDDSLIDGKEVREIAFRITSENEFSLAAAATTEDGTAFYALMHDPLFSAGCTARCTGYLADIEGHTVFVVQELKRGTSYANLVIESTIETLDELKAKAQGNLYMEKAALFKLLDNFTEGSSQHYALAKQLRQQYQDKSEATAIAEKVAVCSSCRAEIQVSNKHAYNFGQAFCNRCEGNVNFDLLDPIPREKTKPMNLEEVQRRLQEKFGNGK